MTYATYEDIQKRYAKPLPDRQMIETLIEDAAVIIDTYSVDASDQAKALVTCNMILRVVGSSDLADVPIGSTQGTVSALGYSQTWTMGNGSSGEMYLSRMDKKLLGSGNKIGCTNPFEGM